MAVVSGSWLSVLRTLCWSPLSVGGSLLVLSTLFFLNRTYSEYPEMETTSLLFCGNTYFNQAAGNKFATEATGENGVPWHLHVCRALWLKSTFLF